MNDFKWVCEKCDADKKDEDQSYDVRDGIFKGRPIWITICQNCYEDLCENSEMTVGGDR